MLFVMFTYYFSVVNSCHRSQLSKDCCMLFVMFTELTISQFNSCHRSELSNDCCMLFVMFTELTISQSLTHVIGAS